MTSESKKLAHRFFDRWMLSDVDEDDLAQLFGVGSQPGLTPAPDGTRRLHIAASLLSGVCRFF